MSIETVVNVGLITFGLVGAVCAGNAAQRIAQRHNCTEAEQMAAGCVGVGLAMAVAPATAAAGMMIVGKKGYEAFKNRKEVLANARAKHEEAMNNWKNKVASA